MKAVLVPLSLALQLFALAFFWQKPASNMGLAFWMSSLAVFSLALLVGSRGKDAGSGDGSGGIWGTLRHFSPESSQARERGRTSFAPALLASSRMFSQGAAGGTGNRPSSRSGVLRLVAVGAVILTALFMRVHQIDSIPGGLYLDEADNGLVGLKLVQAEYSPFTELRDSNGTLYFYLLAFSAKVLGTSAFALRFVAVGVGLLTVVVFYMLARRFVGWHAALAATFLLAVSRWHINFSRIAFEAQIVPLFAALTAYFLVRGLQNGGRVYLALAGLTFGLGFHTYIGFRVFPLILLVFVIHRGFFHRPALRSALLGLVVFLLGTWMTLAPFGVFAARNPEAFVRRMAAASVMSDVERQHSLDPIWSNLQKSLVMFHYEGDPRPRHNLPKQPMLDLVTGVFFAVGVAYSLYRWRNSLNFFLLAWLLLGLTPGVLSLADSNPHSLRTIGNIPSVFLLAGVFLDRVLQHIKTGVHQGAVTPYFSSAEAAPGATSPDGQPGTGARGARLRPTTVQALFVVPLLVLLGVAGYVNYDTFFGKQYQSRSVWDDFDPPENAAGRYTRMATQDKLVLVSGALTNHSAVKFHAYGTPYETLDPSRHLPVRQTVDRDTVYVLEVAHAYLLPELRHLYPGRLTEEKDRYGRLLFYTYTVRRDDANAIHGLVGKYYQLGTEGTAATAVAENPVIERRDSNVSLEEGNTPLPPPFAAEWQGSLLLQRQGDYTLVLESSGSAEISVDDKPALQIADGRASRTILLPAGFHGIVVRYRAGIAKAGLKLGWIPPGGQEEPIPAAALYNLPLSRNGLLGKYYRGNDWSGQPVIAQIDRFIAPNDLLPAPFSIEWEGQIDIPRSGQYLFGTSSDDGSSLYIDDALVVDNGGHHSDRYVEGRANLGEGSHRIRLRYFQDDGGRKLELWWTPPGGAKQVVPVEQLEPTGS